MGKQCRAKDPNSCRVHGSNDHFRSLKEIADNALAAGNVEAYMKVQEAIEDAKKQKISPATALVAIPDEAVEAAAKAEWTITTGSASWDRLGDVWKNKYKEEALGSLQAAAAYMPAGVITDEAVEAAAQSGWEYRDGQHNWNSQPSYEKDKYRQEARAALEAAAPHMKQNDNEEVARKVLGKTYDQFGFNQNSRFVSDIVKILNDPAKSVPEDEGDASPAAEEVRKRLWGQYSGGGASASATSNLFYKLGREKELGWVEEQVPGYRYDPEDFA